MKILNVLVCGSFNKITRPLFEYLIDSGHVIHVIHSEYSDEWMNISSYNLSVVLADNIDVSKYDFQLNFEDFNSYPSIPEMIFDINSDSINVGLISSGKYLSLSSGTIRKKQGLFMVEDLDAVFSVLKVLFIDAIVSLMRIDSIDNRFIVNPDFSNDSFLNYLYLDKKLHSLYQHYQSFYEHESRFCFPCARLSEKSFLEIEMPPGFIEVEKLEAFTLYILMLFNGRRGGLFSYDLKVNNKQISKYIDISPCISFIKLLSLINQPEYEVFEHSLYIGMGFKDFKTDVLVCYDSSSNIEESVLLQIGIDLEKNSLWLSYPKEWYFFSNLQSFLSDFCKHLTVDKTSETQLYDFLYHDLGYFNKQNISWNKTDIPFPKEKSLHQLFMEQVKKTPGNIALVCGNNSLTYDELNKLTNQFSRVIQEFNPKKLIPLCFEPSLDMIVAIISVLKVGCAYVPIDPSYPKKRILHLLKDTETNLVIMQEQFQKLFRDDLLFSGSCLLIDYESLKKYNDSPIDAQSSPIDLAYVIYTSGTSGLPKGVMIEHKSIINTTFSVGSEFLTLDSDDKIAQVYSYTFDPFCLNLSLSLVFGCQLHILDEEYVRDVNLLTSYISAHQISFITVPTAIYQMMSTVDTSLLKTLKYLKCGGERLNKSIENNCHCYEFINSYGPTEATVDSHLAIYGKYLNHLDVNGAKIGRPINNTRSYILDEKLSPLPIGAIGELYIGGAGLARGYLNQPELTKERFINNPFATSNDKEQGYTRLYKTGDLARYLPDGNIEYIGRNDFQVKIRGYRIELGEIEKVLVNYPGVENAVVLSYDTPSSYLAAYYVSPEALDEVLIREHLEKYLPSYMLPAWIVHMDSFPLTISGKLDRKSLPKPTYTGDVYVGARTQIEHKIVGVWEDVLSVDRVGIKDDFFVLGGDSIQSIQVCARLQREGIDCRVKDIVTHRCIERIALEVGDKVGIVAEQGVLGGDFGFLPIQSWFFNLDLEYPNYWNQSFMVRVPKLDISRLNAVIPILVDRHDMLRARFDGKIQSYLTEIPISEISSRELKDVTEEDFSLWQSNFDIKDGPLWRIEYITGYEDGSARLYMSYHHLIMDSVSWRIIIDDIKCLYENKPLGLKSSSYRQWVDSFPEESTGWQSQETDFLLPQISNKEYVSEFSFSREQTLNLLTSVHDAYHTEINDILLTALGIVLKEWLNEPAMTITLESHGRDASDEHLDFSRTVGWFTSMFPVKLEPQDDLGESIICTKENLRHIPNKGIGYRSLDNLPSIVFNYLGQFDDGVDDWHVVNEFSGHSMDARNHRPHVLSMNGMVIDGHLRFNLSTCTSEKDCEQLSRSFETHLLSIIEHCKQKPSMYTPSDFKTVDLSQSLLNKLQENDPNIEAIYPASSLQQGFIYHAISQPEDDAYRV
ncbi:MAG: amino acid adenylation domain-containing protein, partial [Legionellaceae bacterium]|nr:amino acid adenylation domain-containing protein [Legionellaceae bacterium]